MVDINNAFRGKIIVIQKSNESQFRQLRHQVSDGEGTVGGE